MENNPVPALVITLIIYFTLGLSYLGWGRVITKLLGIDKQSTHSEITFIWIGWAFTLLIIQLLHFFFSITAYVVAPIFVIGVVFSLFQGINTFPYRPQKYSKIPRVLGLLFMLSLAAWIASRSMLPPTNYDAGLYYFNMIRWINSFPIIPGLGNLHGRLAFNSSFFTYVAALNFYPYFGYGRSIANSFLFLLTFATFVGYLRPIFKQPSILVHSHPFKYLSVLFTIPILGFYALSSDGFASPSPDLASAFLQLIMFVFLIHGIDEWLNGQYKQDYRAFLLATVAATSVTIKLSNLAFAAVIMVVILAYTLLLWRHPIREASRILVPAALVVLVWCMRGFVLSGVPFYPSTIGYIPVEWAVPRDQVIAEANWVYSWARQLPTQSSNVLGSWNWLKPWLLEKSKDIIRVVYPFVLSALFWVATVFLSLIKKMKHPKFLEWSILIPVIFALIFWFFTAPDPRFAYALFFLMVVCMILLFLSSMHSIISRRKYIAVVCAVFVIGNLNYLPLVTKFKDISMSGYYSINKIPLDERVTLSGLQVYTPKTGDQCWDSPLPCTPFFNPALRLRTSGDLASGFVVSKPALYPSLTEQGAAPGEDSISLQSDK